MVTISQSGASFAEEYEGVESFYDMLLSYLVHESTSLLRQVGENKSSLSTQLIKRLRSLAVFALV